MNEQKIIIFEGCEKTGKSSIAETLSSILNIPIFGSDKSHDRIERTLTETLSSDPFHEAFIYDQPFLLSFLQQTNYSVIQDRAYPSQYVYSQVFKDKGRVFDADLLRKTDIAYQKLNAKIVICVKDKLKLLTQQDEYVNTNRFEEIQNHYLDFAEWTMCDRVVLNTSSQNLTEQISEIMELFV